MSNKFASQFSEAKKGITFEIEKLKIAKQTEENDIDHN